MSTQPEISDSGAPAGALVFLRGEKGADFAEIHSSLLRQDGVAASVPVLGDWNILLRLAAKDRESLKRLVEKCIGSVKGVEGFEAHYCEETWKASGGNDELNATACAVLDVDSGGLSTLVARFRAMAGVVEGNVTAGGKKMVLFLRGNSFREIRDVVSGEIRPLPGVLRVKLLNAMNFS
ncbi:MAG: Lrp/AsnC ligand binding domain-containing protein [Acidobacteriota bacterium]|jgi:DNA-binding Lrp family transcriptional regulator|nr:Lrp/AsnC ligand binding domain-containing protein [Acidobacteriota bacterium]